MENLLAVARQAGAGNGTPVAEVFAYNSDVLAGWQVQVDEPGAATPERVSLPVWLVR